MKKTEIGKTQSRHLSISLLCVLIALLAITVAMCFGCSDSTNTSKTQGQEDAAKLTINEALGSNYKTADKTILSEYSDAKLIAVRTTAGVTEGTTPSWMYLFATESGMGLYTVFLDSNSSSANSALYSQMVFSSEQLQDIPSSDAIKIDANDAYQLVTKNLTDDDTFNSCSVYLLTYVPGADDPAEDTMKWYFEFGNMSDDDTSTESNSSNEEEDSTVSFIYTVDAKTGEVERQ